jgi:hypothetical protein
LSCHAVQSCLQSEKRLAWEPFSRLALGVITDSGQIKPMQHFMSENDAHRCVGNIARDVCSEIRLRENCQRYHCKQANIILVDTGSCDSSCSRYKTKW